MTTSPLTKRRTSLLTIIGGTLLTLSTIALLFLGWQFWLSDVIFGHTQTQAAQNLSEKWRTNPKSEDASVEPVVRSEPAHGEIIGNLYVPRFGEDYVRTIAQGTSLDILSSWDLGIGHYDNTQMPGENGNFALAAHRNSYGGGFRNVDKLQQGDPILVETKDGWYVYRVTESEIVKPSASEVLLPVPHQPGVEAEVPIITLTTCHPLYSVAERYITYGEFESFTPQSEEVPQNIQELLS